MASLQLVAGDFGKGNATYDVGEFRLPGRRLQGAIHITSVEANTTVIEKHWGRAVVDGVRNAAGFAPVAMLVGVFAAPLAAVGTIGIAEAAIGGAIGLLGGGAANKVLLQVTFEQGTGFVAVCDAEVAKAIADDARLLRAQAARERRLREPPLMTRLFGGTPATPTETAVPPATPATLPPSGESGEPGLVESLSVTAAEAVERTGQALSDAFSYVKRTTGLDRE